MRRRSSFAFGDSTFTCTWSVMPWLPVDESIGGSRTSAAGIPAAYTVRRDALLDMTLRIEEAEWTAFYNFIQYGQTKQEITWTPDVLEATTFLVYLESPDTGERIAPSRMGGFERMFEFSITLRGVGTAVPWLAYFTED